MLKTKKLKSRSVLNLGKTEKYIFIDAEHMRGCMISAPDPDQHWIRIQYGKWIRIRIMGGGGEMTHKNKKVKKIHVSKCWMFPSEG